MGMLLVAAVLSLLIGVSLGLLGGGGAILTTPILVYVIGLGAKEAIASSLLVVGVTSAVGTTLHARKGNVAWKTGLVFGAAGMVGAFAGGRAAGYLRGTVLLVAFAAMMLVTAVAMIRGRRAPSGGDGHMHPVKALAVGTAVGFVSGLVGAGGGFLIVPALALFGGVPMLRAVGTSLFVITLQSIAGFAGHIGHAHLQPVLLATVTAAAVAGSLIGTRLAQRVSADALRRGFAWFVLAMGVFVLAKEAPPLATVLSAGVAVGIAIVVSRAAARRREQGGVS